MQDGILTDFYYKNLMIFRALGYASNAANFEITGIDNGSKCLGRGGCNELNAEMRTGGGVPKPMKLSVRIFESSQGSLDPIPAIVAESYCISRLIIIYKASSPHTT